MTEPQPTDSSGQWMPRRRTVVIVVAAVVAALLAIGGVTAFMLQRKVDTPTEVVDAFLQAARDGDAEEAASWWMDLEGTRGGKGLRERVRDYVERWHPLYEKALTGRKWTMSEAEARLGRAVRVTIDGREATYLVTGTDEGPRITLGPEDQFGQSTGDRNPLFG
jgi:hypothetical protein